MPQFKGWKSIFNRLRVFHLKFSQLLQVMIPLRADLPGTSMSHTSPIFWQAYDMTCNHLHAHFTFTYDMQNSRTIPWLHILSGIPLKTVLMAGYGGSLKGLLLHSIVISVVQSLQKKKLYSTVTRHQQVRPPYHTVGLSINTRSSFQLIRSQI